jgi:esterase/lipase superfamily enzyme
MRFLGRLASLPYPLQPIVQICGNANEGDGVLTGLGMRMRSWAALSIALVCCSCVGRPWQGVLVPLAEATDKGSRTPILIATTRERAIGDVGEMFSRERAAAMSYGQLTISIPPDGAREVGEIQWPLSPPGDPRRDFVTTSAEYLEKPRFNAAVDDVAKTTRRSKAMIFVHGFNNRFDDAAYRFAQVVHDSKVPVIPILFSWPSLGVVGLRAYEYDREVARQSSRSLEELLDMIAANPRIREVTLLCHSMGCLLSLNALRSKATRTGRIGGKIKNVVLVAPDVAFDVFDEQMRGMGASRPRFSLFLSQDDQALKISKSIWGGETRLGDINPQEEPL